MLYSAVSHLYQAKNASWASNQGKQNNIQQNEHKDCHTLFTHNYCEFVLDFNLFRAIEREHSYYHNSCFKLTFLSVLSSLAW